MLHDETIMELEPTPCPDALRRRILVIDDDQDQVETLAHALRRQGFDVLSAHSIRAGQAALAVALPELIIMDIRLPDGDGLTLCQQLADDPQTCEIPVIVLSGMERSDIVRRARAAGCLFFLRKPYDPNALLLLAQTALGD
jgi:CheY-like chemotaxis protein